MNYPTGRESRGTGKWTIPTGRESSGTGKWIIPIGRKCTVVSKNGELLERWIIPTGMESRMEGEVLYITWGEWEERRISDLCNRKTSEVARESGSIGRISNLIEKSRECIRQFNEVMCTVQ